MPRVTRAALRSNAALEHGSDLADSIPLPSTPRKERPPLGEIAGNAVEDSRTSDTSSEAIKGKKKGPTRAQKGKASKKTKPEKLVDDGASQEVLEDDNRSTISSAVEEACDSLMKKSDSGSPEVILVDNDSVLPSTPTVDNVYDKDSQVSPPQPEVVTSNNAERSTTEHKDEDSFVSTIKTRTPAKTISTGSVEGLRSLANEDKPQIREASNDWKQDSNDDSFVGKIILRSPAKTMTRIEDTVEAIDAFEDEIEKVGQLMPTMSNTISPVKARKTKQYVTKNVSSKAKTSGPAKTARGQTVATSKSRQDNRIRHHDVNEDIAHSALEKQMTNATKRVSSIHKAPFQPTKSTKPPTRSTFELPGDAVARKLKEQREQRLRNEPPGETKKAENKTALKPIKSTKPLTRSTFELPGEAVARKLKEQREQRLKQQEADSEPNKKDFKARPVRLSQAPVVKGTATSKARMSLAKAEPVSSKATNDHAPTIRSASKRPTSTAPLNTNQRLSSLSVAKRTPPLTAGGSARTTRGPSLAAASSARLSSALATQRVTSDGKSAHQTVRGREVFGRSKTATEEMERVRKEKEEAARKARAEAAERGRVASRQWAEKQKARKISAEKAAAA